MLRAAPSTAAPVKASAAPCRALLRPVVASRRMVTWANAPGKSGDGQKEEHHGLISVWEDKELAEGEVPQIPKPASGEKHTLVSVWEDHELEEAEKKAREAKDNTILNHPTGNNPKTSSYDSEW